MASVRRGRRLDGSASRCLMTSSKTNTVSLILGAGGLSRFRKGYSPPSTVALGFHRAVSAIKRSERQPLAQCDVGLVRVTRAARSTTRSRSPSQRLQYDLYDSSSGVAGAPMLNVRAKREATERCGS